MNSGEENDRSLPNVPLLSSDETIQHGRYHDHDDNDDSGNARLRSEQGYTGGWFVWILTFSAGISGLLFGYEYGDALAGPRT